MYHIELNAMWIVAFFLARVKDSNIILSYLCTLNYTIVYKREVMSNEENLDAALCCHTCARPCSSAPVLPRFTCRNKRLWQTRQKNAAAVEHLTPFWLSGEEDLLSGEIGQTETLWHTLWKNISSLAQSILDNSSATDARFLHPGYGLIIYIMWKMRAINLTLHLHA